MAIDRTHPGHDYKVFFFVEANKGKRNDAILSIMLKFQCNVKIKYVSRVDASLPTGIKDYDSWHFFNLPYHLLTCGDNFSSFQPLSYIAQMLDLMKIPLVLNKLFRKQSHWDKEFVNPDDIETLVRDVACAMADAVGVSDGKGLFLLVTLEKEVIISHSEYVWLLKAKQDALLRKAWDKATRLMQLDE